MFDIISEEEVKSLQKCYGIRANPSMCIFTVKHNNGIPSRAKSRIVVLGNLEQKSWSKTNCFSPVVSIPMIHLLMALAVAHSGTLSNRLIVNLSLSRPPFHLKKSLVLSLQLVDKVVFYHHHANIGYLKELFMVYVMLLVIGTIYFK